jgi:hypothetical protein
MVGRHEHTAVSRIECHVIDLIALYVRPGDRSLLVFWLRGEDKTTFVCSGEEHNSIAHGTSPVVLQFWNLGHDAVG